jgi:predicted TIM-barrel fold metal-dependent hydrolase
MKRNFVLCLSFLLAIAGCQSNYYSDADFSKITKVDAHMHLNTDRTLFEDQAVKDNFALITLNVDHGDSANVKDQLNYSLLAVQKYPDRIFYAPTFYFDTTGWEQDNWSNKVIEQLRRNISKGAVSVKFWKNIGMTVRDRKGNFIMIDNPKLDPVIDFVVKSNLSVTGHLGEPKDCWLPFDKMAVSSDSSYYAANPKYHMYLHPEYPSYDAQINARDNMVAKHPDMQFIGCHLGSLEWSVDELAKRLDKFPNMSVDLAERIVHFQFQSVKDYDKVRNFCLRYQDRILYGTDMSDNGRANADELIAHFHNIWTTDWYYFTSGKEMTSDAFKGKFKGLRLPKEVVNKIFRDNAVRWYKLPVK